MNGKKAALIFLSVVTALCACKDSRINDIMKYYSVDLRYNFSQIDYFVPLVEFMRYDIATMEFDVNREYDDFMLDTISSDNFLSGLKEVCSMSLQSDDMQILIQFPSFDIFNEYREQYRINPYVSREEFERFLQYEYSFSTTTNIDFGWSSDNYMGLFQESLDWNINYIRLSPADAEYYLSAAFIADMDALSAWIREQKWNDKNALLIRNDEDRLAIFNFDPSNDVPIINDIDRVTPDASVAHRYITQTGYYIFNRPDASHIELYENNDGSLDIVFNTGDPGAATQGVRIFLSGAVAEIDETRRVVR